MAQTQRAEGDSSRDSQNGGTSAGAAPNGGYGSVPNAARPPEDPRQAPTPAYGTIGAVGEGRYAITHRLGRGGMAEVYAAQDTRLGRTVAVKLLRSELAEDSVARVRFTREAHSVASLNHHAIVAVYDTGEEPVNHETVPFIVMELVEGRTVRQLLLDEEAPPVDQALIIIAGVLEALGYSHAHGIVHRDIKPANVIITNQGAVKVMDFGIARALTGATSTMTQTGMVMGTPQYLSPEQALGKAVDHRSDLYATGCMLYELLTLRPPFTGDTPLSVVYQHVQDAPVPPSQVNPRVPAALDELVLRSLAKDPDDRFQTADEFRAHIQHALRLMHQAGGLDAAASTMMLGQAGYGTAATEVMRPAAGTPPQGTTAPTRMVAGGYGGGNGHGDGGGGDGDGRRRRVIAAVIGVLLVLGAVGVGLALANSGSGTPSTTNTNSPTSTATDSGSPSASASTDTSSPTANTSPTDTFTQPSAPATTPSAPRTTSAPTNTATASASASPSTGPTNTATATGGATSTSTSVAGGGSTPTGKPTSGPSLP
jgi:serine/threonine protein kinase